MDPGSNPSKCGFPSTSPWPWCIIPCAEDELEQENVPRGDSGHSAEAGIAFPRAWIYCERNLGKIQEVVGDFFPVERVEMLPVGLQEGRSSGMAGRAPPSHQTFTMLRIGFGHCCWVFLLKMSKGRISYKGEKLREYREI